jgi:hypothetical protein
MLGWILMPKRKFIGPVVDLESPRAAESAAPIAIPVADSRPRLHIVKSPPPRNHAEAMRRKWGRPKIGAPEDHAAALLDWLQGEGNADSEDAGAAYTIDHVDAVGGYYDLCIERYWQPIEWNKVAVHFNRMTGGKKYRNAPNPADGGRRTAKVRVYHIPSVAVTDRALQDRRAA